LRCRAPIRKPCRRDERVRIRRPTPTSRRSSIYSASAEAPTPRGREAGRKRHFSIFLDQGVDGPSRTRPSHCCLHRSACCSPGSISSSVADRADRACNLTARRANAADGPINTRRDRRASWRTLSVNSPAPRRLGLESRAEGC
jgi:hypothetical protein